MAGWKKAGQLAVALREAEKAAELKRMQEEQRAEAVRNGTMIRSLMRTRYTTAAKSKADLMRTDKMCKVLAAENHEQTWNCFVAESDYYKRKDEFSKVEVLDWISDLDDAKEEAKKLCSSLDMMRLKERETDKEVFKTQLKLKALNFELAKVHVITAEKVTRRVEVAQQVYGLQLAENRGLVMEIDHLEMERYKVTKVHEELDRDLLALSKELGSYTEEAKNTYEQRDLNRRNMVKLKDHLEKSTQSFESDMQNLQFHIDVLRRMERFMTTKNKFRPDDGKNRRRLKGKQLSQTEKDVILYSSLMEKIKTDLREDNMQVIIKTFLELEEENYMLFKNISETRDTCHLMQVEIDDIREKIHTLRTTKQQKEAESHARRSELMEKRDMCKKEADKKEEYIAEADRLVNTYIKGVLSILENLAYTDQDILRLAGVYKKVEERNIRVFLAEIEHYVNKLYSLKTAADYVAWDQARRMQIGQVQPEPLPPRLAIIQRVVVVPPTYEEEEEADDHELPQEAQFRPLSCDEIIYHVDQRLEVDMDSIELPSPTMEDATSEAIGDRAQSPTSNRANASVDVF